MIDEFKLEESVKKDSVDSWLEDYAEWLSTTKCPWIKAHVNSTSKILNGKFVKSKLQLSQDFYKSFNDNLYIIEIQNSKVANI